VFAALLSAQLVTPMAVQQTGVFASRRITESSGVVVSRVQADLLWTINDSGDGPYLYATTLRGADGGVVRIAGATAVDWEDLALGPCPLADETCVYIADTGDNLERRSEVVVYAVREPPPPAGAADSLQVSTAAAVLRLRYPDGPHDVEAVFVTEAAAVYLITKGRRGIRAVYRVPGSAWGSGGVRTAVLVQQLPVEVAGQVTGADFHSATRRVAIRTYGEIWFLVLRADGTLAREGPACDVRGLEPQGEAVAFWDEQRVVLTSEAGRAGPGPLHLVACQQGEQ